MIRISSLIWWSGVKVDEIPARMAQSQEVRSQADSRAVQVLKEVTNQAEGADGDELPDCAKAALGHISGYMAQTATKAGKCGACSDYLVARDKVSIKVETEGGPDEGADIMHSFSRILDRGRLLMPSPATHISDIDCAQHLQKHHSRSWEQKRSLRLQPAKRGICRHCARNWESE